MDYSLKTTFVYTLVETKPLVLYIIVITVIFATKSCCDTEIFLDITLDRYYVLKEYSWIQLSSFQMGVPLKQGPFKGLFFLLLYSLTSVDGRYNYIYITHVTCVHFIYSSSDYYRISRV